MQPIVVTGCDHPLDPARGFHASALYDTYVSALTNAGACPLICPAQPDAATLDRIAQTADGLLLTGGEDVDPARYGEAKMPACGSVDADRDALEFALLDAFVRLKKPVMGICRGAQVINCYFGGTLFQDLPSQRGVVHTDVAHTVTCDADSFLAPLFGTSFLSNSMHHQSVKTPGEGLDIVARSGDIVEGFVHKTLPVWAVQFHPERMQGAFRLTDGAPDMAGLFDFFVKQMTAE